MRFNDPRRSAAPRTSSAPPSDIGYTFNWFYTDANRSPTSTRAPTRARPKGVDPDFPVWAGRFEWRDFDPDRLTATIRRSPRTRRWSTRGTSCRGTTSRPRASAAPTRTRLLRLPLAAARGPAEAAITGARKTTLPGWSTRWSWPARPTCARTSTCRWRCGSSAGRRDPPARARSSELRAWQRAGALRNDRTATASTSTRGDPAHGRLVAAVGARAVRAPRSAPRPTRRARGRARQRAEQPRRPPRLRLPDRLVRLREQGPADGAQAARSAASYSRALLRRREAQALPAALRRSLRAAIARRPRRRSTATTRCARRQEGDQWCYDVGALAPGRRRHAAADPLDQPADLPAGRRGPGAGAALSDPYDLERFVDAQARLRRRRRGASRRAQAGHWMWFVFPQIAGLGRSRRRSSTPSRSLAEAEAYLAHPVLGPRLLECAAARPRPVGGRRQIFGESTP